MTSQLYGLAPKDLLRGAKINNPALHRFPQAKCNHRRFLPGKQESALNAPGVWTSSLRSTAWSCKEKLPSVRYSGGHCLRKAQAPWIAPQIKLIFPPHFFNQGWGLTGSRKIHFCSLGRQMNDPALLLHPLGDQEVCAAGRAAYFPAVHKGETALSPRGWHAQS